MTDYIRIRGARTHNLKNIDLDIPRHQLVVITGLSGSGKSSLAFDTLYAEGQRRYVESLSSYARQFLQMMDKPDVDLIEGLSPAISIEQKSTSHNPRSTVGTVTEIHDYLRLLFARVGTPHCPEHDIALSSQTVSQMVDSILALPEDTKIMLLAPAVSGRKGEFVELFNDLRVQGFTRVRIDGTTYSLDDELPVLNKNQKHHIDVVIDRIKVRPDMQQRLAESIETALRHGSDRVLALEMDTDVEHWFSAQFACPKCAYSLMELEPRLFSFNNPVGACPTCDGLGTMMYFDEEAVVIHPELSLAAGAIKGWDKRNQFYHQMIVSLAKHYDFDINTPWEDLPKTTQKAVLYGSGKEVIEFKYLNDKGTTFNRSHAFEGVIPNLERRYRETDSQTVREELAKYQSFRACTTCGGARLRKEARFVYVGGENLHHISAWPLSKTLDFFQNLDLGGNKQQIAEKVLKEITERLGFLINVGLNYLSLARSAETLSGGEAQRIRLASQIGSGLTGVMYVLDEPSIGLHQRDNDRLLGTLKHLRDLGNSVIVVEHDEDAIRAADYVVDMGPGAGELGGAVLIADTPEKIAACEQSITGRYLSGKAAIYIPAQRTPKDAERILVLKGASGNNLKDVTLELPLGLMTCITGVSGSGKSTLINDTLAKIAARDLNRATKDEPSPYTEIQGLEQLDKVINVDQSPIGRTPRSNPATYTGVFTPIRELFAGVPVSRERGYNVGRFSFNVKGGRCEACQGDGVLKVEMHFLPDVYVPCEVCHGKRYNRETLEILYKGKNIHQVLEMTVAEAHAFFEAIPTLSRKLQTLMDVGLSYVRLGQSATTLSGGEAQRVKLALELSKRDTGRTLYILDEPTTGLHFADIALLLEVITRLKGKGNSIVIIEHNLDVIKTADYIIDLGPEGGDGGGRIIAQGTPEDVAATAGSYTGQYLSQVLANSQTAAV
ncbi:excinuclease ABC subunit UvrA [Vitreoscilla stercoraria]|uniref:UvrABC system protein A n=1 Tax=Vitreoscilla stercoraria TaxID=61 RepID=A0ABY4E984_VITST|nr:excinuclease ABC subunit UvrA [Vitreoscilla stercoraria]UOO91485.1 excinuclease ABC subunit UvrA [Vitreoscilla stercoraria]